MCGTAVSSKLATCTKRRPLLDPVEPDTAPCLTGNNCHKGPAIPCLAAFVCLAALVAPSSSRWRELNRSPRSMWGELALAALVSLFSSRWRNCTAVLVRCGGSSLWRRSSPYFRRAGGTAPRSSFDVGGARSGGARLPIFVALAELHRGPRSMWGERAPPTAPQRRLCHGRGESSVLRRGPRPQGRLCHGRGGRRRCGAALVPRGACAMAEGIVGAAARPWSGLPAGDLLAGCGRRRLGSRLRAADAAATAAAGGWLGRGRLGQGLAA